MKKRTRRRPSRLPKGPVLVAVGAALVLGACGPKAKPPQVYRGPQPPPQPVPPQDPPPQAVPPEAPEMPDPDAPQPAPQDDRPPGGGMPFLLGPFDR